MRAFLVVTALLAGCTTQSAPECTRSSDCGATEQNPGCTTCPPTASRYCEGQVCKDKLTDARTVSVDLTLPRMQAIKSIRWTAVTFRSTKEIAQCSGQAGCAADAITCDTLNAEGPGGPSQNVAATGASNTDSMNGTITYFPGVQFQGIPRESMVMFIEGRSGTLGAGDTLARLCRVFSADTTSESVTLAAN